LVKHSRLAKIKITADSSSLPSVSSLSEKMLKSKPSIFTSSVLAFSLISSI